jgi:hypothetical protein
MRIKMLAGTPRNHKMMYPILPSSSLNLRMLPSCVGGQTSNASAIHTAVRTATSEAATRWVMAHIDCAERSDSRQKSMVSNQADSFTHGVGLTVAVGSTLGDGDALGDGLAAAFRQLERQFCASRWHCARFALLAPMHS